MKQNIYIIGGTEGIGFSLAKKFSEKGDNIFIFSRSEEKIKNALKNIPAINPGQIIDGKPLDITQFENSKKVTDPLAEKFFPDLAINCAGFARPGYLHGDLELEHIRGMVELNLMGIINGCLLFLPAMRKAKKGHLVNTSSIAGYVGLAGYTGYCASKFGSIGFSEALRREVKPFQIKVSVLCPPNTKTPGLEKENLVKPPEVLKTEEKIKVLTPDEVADYTIKKLKKAPFLIIPTWDGRIARKINNWAPWMMDHLL